MSNVYSAQWFDIFLAPIPPEQTAREINFLARNLLFPTYSNILDVCCGMGRHARELSARGYRVTGVDVNERALEYAQRVDKLTRYVLGDMRELGALGESFDAVLILWQSFGYFDDATNENIVRDIARILNPRGRFVLDIYNRAFFETRLGDQRYVKHGQPYIERKFLEGNRLRVVLFFDIKYEAFEWQIFEPDEISELAARCGFQEILRCANFDETIAVSSDIPRMQFVFEKKEE